MSRKRRPLMPMTWVRAAAALPLLLLVGGMGLACGTPPGAEGGRGLEATTLAELPEGEIPPQPPSRYLGKFIYQNHCGVCHGQIGPTLAVPGTPPPPKEVTLEPAEEQDPGTTGDNAPAKTDLGTAESPVEAATRAAGEPAPNPDAAGEPAQGTGSNEPVTPPGGEEAEDEGNPFYPAPVGPYDDLYTFKWFANGTEFGGYVDRNNAPLADRTYRELFDILREPHGQPGRERDFTTLLSDRERWAVVWYIANQGMDNGQEDWQAIWDQQVQLRKNIYGTHCSICHGAVGRGDGPEGHSFDPKPMNFNQLDWAAGVKPGYPVTDQYLYDIIANGKIKPGAVTEWTGMPWWKDQLRDSDMWGLVDFIRNITFDP